MLTPSQLNLTFNITFIIDTHTVADDLWLMLQYLSSVFNTPVFQQVHTKKVKNLNFFFQLSK